MTARGTGPAIARSEGIARELRWPAAGPNKGGRGAPEGSNLIRRRTRALHLSLPGPSHCCPAISWDDPGLLDMREHATPKWSPPALIRQSSLLDARITSGHDEAKLAYAPVP